MSASVNADKAEPNLVPILDMVFQLITFFMLVINFKSANMDLNLKLPVVGSARQVDTKGQGDLLVLNINDKGGLMVQGIDRPNIKAFIKEEANSARKQAIQADKNFKEDGELPVTIVVRADRATPFRFVDKVVKVCQEQGYRKFNLMAMNKKAEGS
jgi:biopolymer transport protein ExbD